MLEILKQSRSYNNPIKLNNDATYDFIKYNRDDGSYFMSINNQGYFVNDTVKENIIHYKSEVPKLNPTFIIFA
uniref:hypothetical protein n=1 Tax=Mycoplasmopsis felifaucium TaxID=35768 RepID=UPI00056C225D